MNLNRIILKEKQFEWRLRPCDLLYPYKSLQNVRIRYYGCYGLGEYGQLALQHMQYLWLQGCQIEFYCVGFDRHHPDKVGHDPSYLLLRKFMNQALDVVDFVICQCPMEYYPIIQGQEKTNHLIGFLLWQSITLPAWIPTLFNGFNEVICVSSWHTKQYQPYFKQHTLKVIHSISPYSYIPNSLQPIDDSFIKVLDKLKTYPYVFYMIEEYHPQSNIFLGIQYYLKSNHRRKDTCLYLNITLPVSTYQFENSFTKNLHEVRTKYLTDYIKSITDVSRFKPKVIIDCHEHSRQEIQKIHEVGQFYIKTSFGSKTTLEYVDIPAKNTIVTIQEGGHIEYVPHVEGINVYKMSLNQHHKLTENKRNDVSVKTEDLFDQYEADQTDPDHTTWLIPVERSTRQVFKELDKRHTQKNIKNSNCLTNLRRLHRHEWKNVLYNSPIPTSNKNNNNVYIVMVYDGIKDINESLLFYLEQNYHTLILLVIGGHLEACLPQHPKLEVVFLNKSRISFTYYDLFEYIRWNLPTDSTVLLTLNPFMILEEQSLIHQYRERICNDSNTVYVGNTVSTPTCAFEKIRDIEYYIIGGGEYLSSLITVEYKEQLSVPLWTSIGSLALVVLSCLRQCGFHIYNVSNIIRSYVNTNETYRNPAHCLTKMEFYTYFGDNQQQYVYPCKFDDLVDIDDKFVSEKRGNEFFYGRFRRDDTYVQSADYVSKVAKGYMKKLNLDHDTFHYIIYWTVVTLGRFPDIREIYDLSKHERIYMETLYDQFDEFSKMNYNESQKRDIHILLNFYSVIESYQPLLLQDIRYYHCFPYQLEKTVKLPQNFIETPIRNKTEFNINVCDNHRSLLGFINCHIPEITNDHTPISFLNWCLFENREDGFKKNVKDLSLSGFISLMKHISINSSKLYAFSYMPFLDIDDDDKEWFNDFVVNMRLEGHSLYPHYNSFILRYGVFRGLRNYLLKYMPLLISRYNTILRERCCIGHYIERLIGYYVGTQYEDVEKMKMGDLLGEPYINTNPVCDYYDYHFISPLRELRQQTGKYTLEEWYNIFERNNYWLPGYNREYILTEKDMRLYQDVYPERLIKGKTLVMTGSEFLYDYFRVSGFHVYRVDERFSKELIGQDVLSIYS